MRVASITCYSHGMRTTIDLPDALLDNAKRCARERGITLSVLLQDALRHQLTRRDAFPETAFRLPTVRGKSVSPTVDLDRTSSLIVLDDELSFGRGM